LVVRLGWVAEGRGRLGALFRATQFQCWTLENTLRAIPIGVFPVALQDSPRLGRLVPWLTVPGRTAIEIHPANTPEELEGCLAVGRTHTDQGVWESQAAFADLMAATPFPTTVTLVAVPPNGLS
jgi:hypothetical protein